MRIPRSDGPSSWQNAALGIASVAFGMIMREIADRQRAAQRAQPATPVADPPPPRAEPAAAPEIVIRVVRPLPPRPEPRQPEPPAHQGGWLNRPVTWGRWSVYLAGRLLLAGLTVILLEISSTSQVRSCVYFAAVLTIVALLIPYGRPHEGRDPDNVGVIVTMCSAVLAVAIWPWFFYTAATAPRTPVAVVATKSFSLSSQVTGQSCIGLLDNQQHLWLINRSLSGAIKNNRIVLYQTAFGWTSDSQPTQSPSPLFGTPHLNQPGYSLTPSDANTPACLINNSSGGH